MNGKYNSRSPAVKRLMREAAELSQPAAEYFAAPLEDNLFEWHFTVRGPSDTDFQGGVYHGRIIVPSEYPMKPPDIILLTPNGRFEVGKKICLSISGYHPETWQPSWSIRTALLAIIGFMPTEAKSFEVGAVKYPADERRRLASRSRDWTCPTCEARPADLLASPDQESNISQSEVDEIVNSFQLKGSPTTEKSADSQESRDTETGSSSRQNESADPDDPSQSRISENESTGVESSRIESEQSHLSTEPETDEAESSSSSWPGGLQASDLLITVLLLVVAFLLYRRFSGQAFKLLGGSDEQEL